jgi:hypothetical protein
MSCATTETHEARENNNQPPGVEGFKQYVQYLKDNNISVVMMSQPTKEELEEMKEAEEEEEEELRRMEETLKIQNEKIAKSFEKMGLRKNSEGKWEQIPENEKPIQPERKWRWEESPIEPENNKSKTKWFGWF